MSRGEMSFGEKRRREKRLLGRNVAPVQILKKKWGKMSFGEKRRREKYRGEKCNLGKNVLHPDKHI